jgi:hypothetical protein
MIIPHWLEQLIEPAQSSAPVILLLVVIAVLWWRSLHSAN